MDSYNVTEVWFSETDMHFHQALIYCSAMNSRMIEPHNKDVFNEMVDIGRRTGITRVWIGISVDEEGS